jgi:molybdopterin molybdotransferase
MTILDPIVRQGCGCDAPDEVAPLVSIDEALRLIAEAVAPVRQTERLALDAAGGRVLAAPVRATAACPPFDNAAMDGYAVATAFLEGDGPWSLPVATRIPAGRSSGLRIDRPVAARIFTGAPIPPGADAVVRQEDVERDGAGVRIARRPEAGLNIRRAGSDMAAGQAILAAGTRLGPRQVAAAAAAGAGEVCVSRRLRVGLLVTGDEVRDAGATRRDGQIWDVNTPMLRALLAGPGFDLARVEHGADRRPELRRQLETLSHDVDLVVTTGGISVGEEDHVKPALASLDAAFVFSGVAIKPGKPVSFGRRGGAFWLGLPGNPLSAFVCWQIFGRAILRGLAGATMEAPRRRHVVLDRAIRRKPGRCELGPATLVGFDPAGREVAAFEDAVHSDRVAGLAKADGLVFLPGDCDFLPGGALVEFQPFCDS